MGAGKAGSGPGGSGPDLKLYLLLLSSWAPLALVLLLTFDQWPVSLGLDSIQNLGWWSSPTLSRQEKRIATQERALSSKEENVPPAQGSCVILARATRRGVTGA